MDTIDSDVRSLVETVYSCLTKYYPRVYGSAYQGVLHGPPVAAGLLEFLAGEGTRFPPSYKAFLRHHNGWNGYVAGFTLIGVDGQHTIEARRDIDETLEIIADAWSGERASQIADAITRREDQSEKGPDVGTMVPFGTDFNGALLLFDPRTRRPDGEMDVLLYDTSGCSKEYRGFIEMLTADREEVCRQAEDEREEELKG